LLFPCAAFAQSQPSWFDVSPGTIYRPPADPSCYVVTVGDGAYMTIDLEYHYQGSGPMNVYSWLTLDGNGQAVVCIDSGTWYGLYEFTGVRNSALYWEPFVSGYSGVTVAPT